MKAAPTRLDAADLVGFTLAAFTESGSGSRETLLTERELLLYAARRPALRRRTWLSGPSASASCPP